MITSTDSVATNQRARYLGQRSFCSEDIVPTHTHTNTHQNDCSVWTTKMVGNDDDNDNGKMQLQLLQVGDRNG